MGKLVGFVHGGAELETNVELGVDGFGKAPDGRSGNGVCNFGPVNLFVFDGSFIPLGLALSGIGDFVDAIVDHVSGGGSIASFDVGEGALGGIDVVNLGPAFEVDADGADVNGGAVSTSGG